MPDRVSGKSWTDIRTDFKPMKKKYPTFIDESAKKYDRIYVSAGMRGEQLILAPDALAAFVGSEFKNLTK